MEAQTVLLGKPDELAHGCGRITLAAAHDVNDITPPIALAHGVHDRDRRGVVPTAAHIDEGEIDHAVARRQLKRPTVLDRGIDRRIIQERADVDAEFCIPFRTGCGRIGRALRRDRGVGQRRVEHLTPAPHDQRFGIVDAVKVAPLLVQQSELAIRRRNADQHAVRGGHAIAAQVLQSQRVLHDC
jgi:hypothetical protein